MKLPTVFLLVAGVLVAGFGATVYLEQRDGGGAIVPSVVVVDAPQIVDPEAIRALTTRFDELRRVSTPEGGERLFGPFTNEVIGTLTERGHRVIAFALDPVDGDELRNGAWDAVIDEYPRISTRSASRESISQVASFILGEDTTRPFVLGLSLADQGQGNLGQLLEPVVNALEGLPWYRRSSLVIIAGQRETDGIRPILRLDCGRDPARVPPDGISDLLDPRW